MSLDLRVLVVCWTMVAAGLHTQLPGNATAGEEQAPDGIPMTISREMSSDELLPDGEYAEILSLEAESDDYSHTTGRAVDDAQAGGGRAWGVDADTDSPGHLLYGPYAETEAGNYVAFFRVKMTGEPAEYVAVRLDACKSQGAQILADREVLCTDLTAERYVQIPLDFHHPGGKLECRALWNGGASLLVDSVAVCRLKNGVLAPGPSVRKVPLPVASGKPRDLVYKPESRAFDRMFPRSGAPESNLLVMDLTKQPQDWQLLLRTLQGIVNRERPRIYFIGNDQDRQWLDWMLKRGWVKSTETVTDAEELVSRFRSSLRGAVVPDPALPPTKNVATMIAGVEDSVVASPRLAKKLSVPVVADLRGRWKTGVEAYRWAMDNLWPRMNHYVLACLWPDNYELRDYLVQHRIFTFWIPGSIDGARAYSRPDEEMRLVEELLARTPPNTPIMGYSYAGPEVGIGEGGGVTLFSEFAKFLVGSVGSSNLSMHSGIEVEKYRQPTRLAPELQKSKVYLCFTMSDGDNLPVMTIANWPQMWADKTRGEIPVGWTISPASWMLIPGVMDYYYSTAKAADTFMAAVSGVGYCYPDSYAKRYRASDRAIVLDEFLRLTDAHMRKMGLRAVCPSLGSSAITRYAERVGSGQAIFPDYGRAVTSYDDATFITERGIPVFRAATTWDQNATREQAIRSLTSQIREMAGPNRPAFLHVFICNWFWDIPAMKEVVKRLGPGYVAVGPDELAALHKKHAESEKVQVRGLPSVAFFEDQAVRLPAKVRNTSGRPFEVSVVALDGLKRARVKPERRNLAPGQEAAFEISGIPANDHVRVEIRGEFGAKAVTTGLLSVKQAELEGDLPDVTKLTSVALYEAESLNHQIGRKVKDADASRGTAWASPSREKSPGFVLFGPYAGLKPGRYLAVFRLKRDGEGSGVAARLDTCANTGATVNACRDVQCEELPDGRYRAFSVEFEHPGGAVETRVFWNGTAPIAVDYVGVWEVCPS